MTIQLPFHSRWNGLERICVLKHLALDARLVMSGSE